MKVTKYKLYYPLENGKYLLINTLTGALDIVEKEIIDYLNCLENEDTVKDLDEEIILSLRKRGYIIEENEDTSLLNRMLNFYENINDLISFTICPTYSCNLRCGYCFENLNIKEQKKVLDNTEIDKIFEAMNIIASKRNIKKRKIQLFGGEPFQPITKRSIEYIFKKSKKDNYSIIGITNGTYLDLFEDILKKNKDCISYIQITLDGPKTLHNKSRVTSKNEGTFDKICSNIQMLLDIGINVVARVNIGKNNIYYLRELFDFYEKMSWTKYDNFVTQLTPITDHRSNGNLIDWMPENEILKEINNIFGDIEYIRKRYKVVLGTDMERRTKLIRSIWNKNNRPLTLNPCSCGAGSRIYYVFGADGKIYPCPETVGEIKYSIGDYLPELKIDKTKDKLWKRNIMNIKKCIECNIAPLCGTSCTWSSIATNGINFEEPVCNYAKETIDDYFKMNAERIINILKEDL